MAAIGLRLLGILPAIVGLVLCMSSAAEARHWRHYGHHWHDSYYGFYGERAPRARDSRPEPSRSAPAPAEANGFAAALAQMIRTCDAQAAELQNTPFDMVLKTVQPRDDQRAAWEQIHTAAADAASKLTATCPKNVPARLTDRLDTMRTALDAIKAALVPLRPVFAAAYATLDDEQKARLVALAIRQSAAPQSGPGANAANSAASQTPDISLGCRQWPAMLKGWPLRRVEDGLALSDEQHAALYTLMAAIYRAAGGVAASCHDENVLTPVARLDAELNRVDALRQCADAIAPALSGFANSLNDEQIAQLNAALGVVPQPETTAR